MQGSSRYGEHKDSKTEKEGDPSQLDGSAASKQQGKISEGGRRNQGTAGTIQQKTAAARKHQKGRSGNREHGYIDTWPQRRYQQTHGRKGKHHKAIKKRSGNRKTG